MMITSKTVRKKFIAIRKAGLSQAQIAEYIKENGYSCSQQTIHRYEKDPQRDISLRMAEMIDNLHNDVVKGIIEA